MTVIINGKTYEAGELIAYVKKLEQENTKLREEVDKLDFFYEGNGFTRRGLTNSIQIANYIEEIEHQAGFKCNQELMQKTKEAKEIISEWLRLHNSNTKKTIIKKSEYFLKEE